MAPPADHDMPPLERRLTIAQLLPALDGGGVERGTLEVSRALVERGHQSLVVSAGGRLVDELRGHGAQHLTLDIGRKSPLTLRHARRLRSWCLENGVDILHPRSRMPAWVATRALKGRQAPPYPRLITSVHGLHSVSWYSRVVTAGERVEVVSEAAQRYALENYPATDPAKLVLIPRGVDPAAFAHGHRPSAAWTQTWRQDFPHLQDRWVIALPGRLTRLKGHHDFLGILERLQAADLPRPAHGLIIGGEDPKRAAYAAELRDAVRQRGLAENVTFTGHRADVRDVLASCDACVSLSTKPESFGRAVLESVALGVPTLGYDHGGVGDVLARVYPAGRIPLGDLDAAAHRLAQLAAGDMAPPAADPTLGGLTLQAMLDRTLAMYESLAQAPRR